MTKTKPRTRQELEREVARLEQQVTELQTVSTQQVQAIRDLDDTVKDRTGTILMMMEACCDVGLEHERLFVYGSTLAVERVRGLVHRLGLRTMAPSVAMSCNAERRGDDHAQDH